MILDFRFNASTNPMPEIQMPKLSDTMTEGTLIAWKKKKGDKVSAGEVWKLVSGEGAGRVQR